MGSYFTTKNAATKDKRLRDLGGLPRFLPALGRKKEGRIQRRRENAWQMKEDGHEEEVLRLALTSQMGTIFHLTFSADKNECSLDAGRPAISLFPPSLPLLALNQKRLDETMS